MVTLILLSNASSLALEQPGSIVLRMSGPRRRIFRASSTISGMRLWKTACGLPVRDARQPRALRLEVAREPAARLGPRRHRDHDPAPGAVHSRHAGDRFDPPAAEIPMTPTTTAAATVVTAALPAAAGASEHAPAWTHADLEHGSGTQRRIRDPHILDHRAFDVEKLFEYAVHQAPAAG